MHLITPLLDHYYHKHISIHPSIISYHSISLILTSARSLLITTAHMIFFGSAPLQHVPPQYYHESLFIILVVWLNELQCQGFGYYIYRPSIRDHLKFSAWIKWKWYIIPYECVLHYLEYCMAVMANVTKGEIFVNEFKFLFYNFLLM